jgi:DNA-binding beta-propeller fold protein YncE
MKKLRLGLAAVLAVLSASAAQAGIIYLGGYPDQLVLFDEATGTVKQKVTLDTGLPVSLQLSNNKKTLYVTTITTSGIEVLDIASGRVTNKFSLNTPTTRYRFYGGVADAAGRYFYTIAERIDKEIDRYKISKPQYVVVDLQQKKIVRTADIEPQDASFNYRMGSMLSEDGKSLYLFRDKILILNTADMKVAERLDLAKPDFGGMENVNFGGGVENIRSTREFVSLFNASDPYIHNKVFGIARLDLSTRRFSFTPIGPAPASMAGLQVTPDGKEGYTVVTNGTLGNKRCEFWRFDLTTNKVLAKQEFECRSRFQFGMSGDGKKLYIYGASFNIEVYDAKTLAMEKDWDLGNDATMAGMVITQ